MTSVGCSLVGSFYVNFLRHDMFFSHQTASRAAFGAGLSQKVSDVEPFTGVTGHVSFGSNRFSFGQGIEPSSKIVTAGVRIKYEAPEQVLF